ncbi:MAG: hypothetical protein IPK07_00905 [Deltaproteobacteria bacterium]|jgi:hypothetical protein|nr:hypothetical protein [Deltaproteobacteria bacterium]
MPPDVLERLSDDVENANESGAPKLATASARSAFDSFGALRARIAECPDAFQAWEPVYKHLRARPGELEELLRRVREVRSAFPVRGLSYRTARDALLRDWALEQLDVDTRALLASLDASRAELRRDARARVEAYLRAEAELRFRALTALATVSAAVDPERPAARRALTGPVLTAADEGAGPLAGPDAVPRLPWRAAVLAAAAFGLAGALAAVVLDSTAIQVVALVAAAASLPILALPRWVARTWADFHASHAALAPVFAGAARPPPAPYPLTSTQARAVRAALESTAIAPTAAHVAELLEALGFDGDEELDGTAGPSGDGEPALPFGADGGSLRDAAGALHEVCSVARVPRLVAESPAATSFVRSFIDNARAHHALCAADPEAPWVLGAASFGALDEARVLHDALADSAVDALVAALDELGFGPRDELDARRVGALRVSIERLPDPVRYPVESATFERLDALCRRWASGVTAWCERMAERSQLAALEASDAGDARHEERRVAELDELAHRVRITEIRSDEVRRDLADAARAAGSVAAARLRSGARAAAFEPRAP